MYFCNGDGDTPDSHLVHYMRLKHLEFFDFPESNPFFGVNFQCFHCPWKNFFDLSLVPSGESFYIICRNCQDTKKEDLRQLNLEFEKSRPLISNGHIINDILTPPDPSEYQQVPLCDIVAIDRELGISGESISDKSVIKAVKVKYDSLEEYSSMMTAFVESEENATRELFDRLKCNVELTKNTDDHTLCYCSVPYTIFEAVSVGKKVQLEKDGVFACGIVTQKQENRSTIHVILKEKAPFADKENVLLSVVFDESKFSRQKEAIKRFSQGMGSPFFRDIILGKVDQKTIREKGKLKHKVFLYAPKRAESMSLDSLQVSVVDKACSSRFSLIQGTAASGKTSVTIAILYSLLRAGIQPILLRVSSTAIAERVTATLGKDGVKTCWIGSPTGLDGLKSEYSLQTLVKKDPDYDPKAKAKFSKQKLSVVKNKIIRECSLVCVVENAGGYSELSTRLKFMAAVIHDCQNCLDPELLVVLSYDPKHLVLVGDLSAPGAVIASPACQLARYDVTLLQRLLAVGIRPAVLRTQYRMHPEIASFVSDCFYNGHMVSSTVHDMNKPVWLGIRNGPRVVFCDVQGVEEVDTQSYFNTNEVDRIARLLPRIGRDNPSIVIMTPSVAQEWRLFNALSQMKNKPESVRIGPVERFRGEEADIVILSCVRVNSSHEIGVWSDPRYPLLAVTRAKYGVLIVGSAQTLSGNETWKRIIDYCASINGLLTD